MNFLPVGLAVEIVRQYLKDARLPAIGTVQAVRGLCMADISRNSVTGQTKPAQARYPESILLFQGTLKYFQICT